MRAPRRRTVHRATAVAAAVVALAAPLAACGGSDGAGNRPPLLPGGSLPAQPSAAAPTSTASSTASSTANSGADSPEVTGNVPLGQTLSLEGRDGRVRADVTALRWLDKAQPTIPYFQAAAGNRLVAAQFRIVSTGSAPYHDTGYNVAKAIVSTGKGYISRPGAITAGEMLPLGMVLMPGDSVTGWVLIEVPANAEITAVAYQMGATGMDDLRAGRWSIR
jgi:hypothetical protein